ncbi:MAG: hypothetical protein R2851_21890 [Caldilineaceae bacterium]
MEEGNQMMYQASSQVDGPVTRPCAPRWMRQMVSADRASLIHGMRLRAPVGMVIAATGVRPDAAERAGIWR